MSPDTFGDAVASCSNIVDVGSNASSPEFLQSSELSEEAACASGTDSGDGVESEPPTFLCQVCQKVLKSSNGLLRHRILHKLNEANIRKPDFETVGPVIEEKVVETLRYIAAEYAASLDAKSFIECIFSAMSSKGALWYYFLSALADPLLDIVCQRLKVLPSSQDEDQLKELNQLLNQSELMNTLKTQLLMLTEGHQSNDKTIHMIIFRLISKLFDALQIYIYQEMQKEEKDKQQTEEIFTFSEHEKKAFAMHIEKNLRAYHKRGVTCKKELWYKRCRCIRQNFVTLQGNCDMSAALFLGPKSWADGGEMHGRLIQLSEKALDFFCIVEKFLRFLGVDSSLNLSKRAELLIEKLALSDNSTSLDFWQSLIFGYLSESESLGFLQEIVSILISLSCRLETDRVRREHEESSKKQQKHALRADLKQN